MDNLVSETVKAFGSLDVLVNNAGGGWSRHEKAEDTPYDKWLIAVDSNLNGAFLCSMAAGKQMIKQQGGRITVVDDDVPPLEQRPGTEHVANMIRFLASPASDMITGEAIPVRAWFKSDRFWQ